MFWLLLRTIHTASTWSLQHFPLSRWQVVDMVFGGNISRTADPNCPQGYSIPCDVCLAIEARRKRRGAFFIMTFVFQSNCYMDWSPASQGMAGYCLLIGSRQQVFWFSLLLHVQCLLLLYLTPFYLDPYVFFHLIFSLPCPNEEESDTAAWWATDVQSRSTQHMI